MCRTAMQLAQRDDERRLVLDALGRIATADALTMVTPCLDKPALASSACRAAVAISERMAEEDRQSAAKAMRRVLQITKDPELTRRANAILRPAESTPPSR